MNAAIVGIGHTAYTRASGVSDTALAAEACTKALADAGLGFDDIDGLVTYDHDASDPWYFAGALALGDLTWFSRTSYGGGMTGGAVQDAALAVGARLARVVLVYRAGNMRSGARFGQASFFAGPDPTLQWTSPYGAVTPAQRVAPILQRYMYERNADNRDLAVVSTTQREYAAVNPDAHFYGRPLSLDEHQQSRWVMEPVLRVTDCCLETDGGVALVVVHESDADGLHETPVHIRGAARAMARGSQRMSNYYTDVARFPDLSVVATQLWRQSGIGPADLQAAIVYDAFGPYVPMALEELGVCARGDGVRFVLDGQTRADGRLPVNTNGGQLAEAYIHGFNGLVEAVRQIRGRSVNQLPDVTNVVCVGSPAGATSGLVLSSESGARRAGR